MIRKVNRGDVFMYDFGNNYSSSVECKKRPALIVSNNKGNTYGSTCLIAPITTRTKDSVKHNPWQVFFYNESRPQVILLEQIKCVSINQLGDYIGHLDDIIMHNVDVALCIEFDLPISNDVINETILLNNVNCLMTSIINEKSKNIDNVNKKLSSNLEKSFNQMLMKVSTICNDYERLNNNECDIYSALKDIKLSFNDYTQKVSNTLSVLINLYNSLKVNNVPIVPLENECITVPKKNNCIKYNKYKKHVSINNIKDKIEFLDFYIAHPIKDVEEKYHFDKKSIYNRKFNYIKSLQKQGIDVSKYIGRKNYIKEI